MRLAIGGGVGKGEEGDEQRNDDEEEERRRMISEATAERRRRLRKEWRYGDRDGDEDEEAERFGRGKLDTQMFQIPSLP